MIKRTHRPMYNRQHRKIAGLVIALLGITALLMVAMPLRALVLQL